MKDRDAVPSLAAPAHEHRLLVRRGPSGVPAGEIADEVGISATNTSFHLDELERTGLLRATRRGRHVLCAVPVEGVRKLLSLPDGLLGRSFAARLSARRAGRAAPPNEQRGTSCGGHNEAAMRERPCNVLSPRTYNSARSILDASREEA